MSANAHSVVEATPLSRRLAGAVVILYALISLVPLVWIVLTSLKTPPDSIAYPPKWVFEPSLEGYVNVFTNRSRQAPEYMQTLPPATSWYDELVRSRNMVITGPSRFLERYANSLIIGFGSTFLAVFLGTLAAYGFSRFRIPGIRYIFFLLIATIMIPSNITLVPTYFLFSRNGLDWIGTWLPLIVPHFFGNAILIFLLRQNFKSIPRDLDEAAMLDGAGPLRILISVILPQSTPVVTTVALLHFFYVWNETRLTSLYLGIAPDLQTISFGIQRTQTLFFTPDALMVGALVAMIVPVIVLLFSQRFFMQDMIVTQIEK